MSKKIIFILPQDKFGELEYNAISAALSRNNISWVKASNTRNRVSGDRGLSFEPDLAIPEITDNNFSGMIIIGDLDSYTNYDQLLKLVQNFKKNNLVIGAVNSAVLILARAGVLISKTVTGSLACEKELIDAGAEYTGMAVEDDGLIVTARDYLAADEFVKKIVYLLQV